MSKINYVSLFLSVLALCACGYIGWSNYHHKKYAYIELKKVFDEFEMSKQYNNKLEATLSRRKLISDSMEVNLKAAARLLATKNIKSGPEADEFIMNKETYLEKRKQFEEDNNALRQQYNTEITKQLNQYIRDYGEKNKYELVLGADGSGGIMYAEDKLNVTEEVIKYINARYQGNSK